MAESVEMYCVYIINTCDYCIDILPSLQQSIEDKIDSEYADKVDLNNQAQEMFNQLI